MSYHDLKLGDMLLPSSVLYDIEQAQVHNMTNFAKAIPELVEWLKENPHTEDNGRERKRVVEQLVNQIAYVNKYLTVVAKINYVEITEA